jgi:hypothetical protein
MFDSGGSATVYIGRFFNESVAVKKVEKSRMKLFLKEKMV